MKKGREGAVEQEDGGIRCIEGKENEGDEAMKKRTGVMEAWHENHIVQN